jgi:hypothetical protein
VAISIPDMYLGAAPPPTRPVMLFLHVIEAFFLFIFHLHLLVFLEYPIKDRLHQIMVNGFHEVFGSSVLFGVELNVRREVPEHLVFDYKNANWVLFRREMDSRMNLNFSHDRVEWLTLTL